MNGLVTRRELLALLGGAAALAQAGCFRLARPQEPQVRLSEAARALLARSWRGIDPARALDVHAHLAGLGTGGSGAWASPTLRQPFRHPGAFARFSIYVGAAGIDDLSRADELFVERLVARVRWQQPHRRLVLLPFDYARDERGEVDLAASEFHVPNDLALSLAGRYPDCFVAGASIHPYRPDAVDELSRVAAAGAVLVKWLPSAMRIDPASPRCDAFYRKLAALGVPLLTHGGEERAVEADAAQAFGNPLLLRRALDAGVKVIVAHCASLGESPDLDAPGAPRVASHELFLRLAVDPRYRGRLFGDTSALTQFNRCGVLPALLLRPELHGLLVDGSDYPLPAIDALVRTGQLAELGLITPRDRQLLNELNRHDPLAFDFALKRTLRIEDGERLHAFPPSVFMPPASLFPGLRPPPIAVISRERT